VLKITSLRKKQSNAKDRQNHVVKKNLFSVSKEPVLVVERTGSLFQENKFFQFKEQVLSKQRTSTFKTENRFFFKDIFNPHLKGVATASPTQKKSRFYYKKNIFYNFCTIRENILR